MNVTTAQSVAHKLMNPDIWDGKLYARGWKRSQNGTAQVTDKSTGEILATVANASVAEIREASSLAVSAGEQWAKVSSQTRAAILRRAGEILDQHSEEVVYWLIRESGSPRLKAILEVRAAKEYLYHAADLAVHPTMKVLKNDDDMLSSIERVPLGVVGVIAPFNFPLALALRSIAAALAMGNSVVLKPSLNTAVSGGVVIARVLEEACLPEGVLQVLPGGDEAGAALTDDPHVSMIAFTGSTAVGRKIGMTAGSTLKRISLELGGKNPFVVLSDADLESAARAGAFSTFFHQGQLCIAVGIHLVHETLIDRYAARMAELGKVIKVGNPYLDQVGLGPIISQKQRDRVHSLVEEAIRLGAELLEGGSFQGLFYRPTVLKNVPQNARAFKEEIFGPVAVIVSFKDESEAIRLANGTGYGLTASVFGELQRARKVGEQIETGMLHINDTTLIGDAKAPFGGVKGSGNFARIGGRASIEDYTTWRWTTETRQPTSYEIPAG
jgi:benzaldehyde dehydrogenase (NAD)